MWEGLCGGNTVGCGKAEVGGWWWMMVAGSGGVVVKWRWWEGG